MQVVIIFTYGGGNHQRDNDHCGGIILITLNEVPLVFSKKYK